jgi:hypothetical protein
MIAFTSSTATDADDTSSSEGGLVRMPESGGIAVEIRLSYTACDGDEAIVSNTSSTIAVRTGSASESRSDRALHGGLSEIHLSRLYPRPAR